MSTHSPHAHAPHEQGSAHEEHEEHEEILPEEPPSPGWLPLLGLGLFLLAILIFLLNQSATSEAGSLTEGTKVGEKTH